MKFNSLKNIHFQISNLFIIFCFQFSYAQEYPILLPFKVDSLWGYCNGNYEIIIPAVFDEAFPFENGLAKVGVLKMSEKALSPSIRRGIINKKGGFVIPAIYHDFIKYEKNKQQFFVSEIRNNKEIYNGSGECITDRIYADEFILYDSFFTARFDNGSIGLYSYDSDTIINADFIELKPIGNLILYKTKYYDKYGLIDFNENKITGPLYEKIDYIGNKKYACYKDGGIWHIYNEKGDRVSYKLNYKRMSGNSWLSKSNLMSVKAGEESVYIDTLGGIVLKDRFEDARPFNKYGVACVSKDGMYGAIDTSGKTIIPFNYDLLLNYNSDKRLLYALKGEKIGLIDYMEKEDVIPIEYDEIYRIAGGGYILQDKDTFRLFSPEKGEVILSFPKQYSPGKEYIPFIQDSAFYLAGNDGKILKKVNGVKSWKNCSDFFLIEKNDRCYFLNKEYELVEIAIEGFDYKNCKCFNNVIGKFDDNSRRSKISYYINFKGVKLDFNTNLRQVNLAKEKLYPYRKGNFWGYVNENLEWVIPPSYTLAFPFYNERAVVYIHNKKGIIDNHGKIIIPFDFNTEIIWPKRNEPPLFEAKRIVINKNNSYSIYDVDGRLIAADQKGSVRKRYGDAFWVRKWGGNEWQQGLIGENGNVLVPFDEYSDFIFLGADCFLLKKSHSIGAVFNIDGKQLTSFHGRWGFVNYHENKWADLNFILEKADIDIIDEKFIEGNRPLAMQLVHSFNEGVGHIRTNKSFLYFDEKGDTLFHGGCVMSYPYKYGYAKIQRSSSRLSTRLYDKNGNVVFDDYIDVLSCGKYFERPIYGRFKSELVDVNGEKIFDTQFERIDPLNGDDENCPDLFRIFNDGRYSVIDINGEQVVPPYKLISTVADGYIQVMDDQLMTALFDLKGKMIVPFQQSEMREGVKFTVSKNLIAVEKGGKPILKYYLKNGTPLFED